MANTDFVHIRDGIHDILNSPEEGPRKFACADHLLSAPNPGLVIDGHGPVGLPLTDSDAKAIISKARQSPFGKQEQTIVDTSVRKSWELQPDQFSIRNTSWDKQIKEMVASVYHKLGLVCGQTNVRAELNKLLLYEAGAFFRPHKDSEKAPGMFGTLVICLPSPHQGGQLALQHRDEVFNFDTSAASDFGFSYAAWYADITHEVKEITSGYRLMLTYNLVKADSRVYIPSIADDSSEESPLATELRNFDELLRQRTKEVPPFLIHQLEHEYCQASLSEHLLKGNDLECVRMVNAACAEVGGKAYLAIIERKVTKDEEWDMQQQEWALEEVDEDEEDEESYEGCGKEDETRNAYNDEADREEELQVVVDMDGSVVCTELDIPQYSLTDNPVLRDSDADESDHEGWTGNEGAPVHYWYRDAAVIIVPYHGIIDFRFRCCKDIASKQTLLHELRSSATEDRANKGDLAQLCDTAIEWCRSKTLAWDSLYRTWRPDTQLGREDFAKEIVNTTLDFDELEIFDRALSQLSISLEDGVAEAISRTIIRNGMPTMQSRLEACLGKSRNPHKKASFLRKIKALLNAPESVATGKTVKDFQQWSTMALLEGISHSATTTLGKADARAIAELCQELDPDKIEKVVFKTIRSTMPATRVAFFNEFLSRSAASLPPSQASVVETELNRIWTDFAFPYEERPRDPGIMASSRRKIETEFETDHMLDGTNLSQLIRSTSDHVAELYVDDMCQTLKTAMESAPAGVFTETIIPFLHDLIERQLQDLHDENKDPTEACQELVAKALNEYVRRCVGEKPEVPKTWEQQARGCGCEDCRFVDKFLRSKTEKEFVFPAAERRRKHLDWQYADRGYGPQDDVKSYDITTVRKGSPFTWRMTKNRAGYQSDRNKWAARQRSAHDTLERLDQARSLKPYLSADYNAYMLANVENLPAIVKRTLQPTSGNATTNANARAKTTKRRVSDVEQGEELLITRKKLRSNSTYEEATENAGDGHEGGRVEEQANFIDLT